MNCWLLCIYLAGVDAVQIYGSVLRFSVDSQPQTSIVHLYISIGDGLYRTANVLCWSSYRHAGGRHWRCQPRLRGIWDDQVARRHSKHHANRRPRHCGRRWAHYSQLATDAMRPSGAGSFPGRKNSRHVECSEDQPDRIPAGFSQQHRQSSHAEHDSRLQGQFCLHLFLWSLSLFVELHVEQCRLNDCSSLYLSNPPYKLENDRPSNSLTENSNYCNFAVLLGRPTLSADLVFTAILSSSSISSIFFRQLYPPSSLDRTQPKPATCLEVSVIWKCMSEIWGIFKTTFLRRLRSLTATLTAYVFGMKHDVHNRVIAVATTRGVLHRPKRSSTLVHKRLKTGPAFYPLSVNSAFYLIVRLRTQNSTKSCQTMGK